MNLGCLGNAVDHFKGSLFRRLTERQLLVKLAVDPMITDFPSWDDEALRLYCDLVGIALRPAQLISMSANGRRRPPEIPGHTGDFFLDPTTGVRYGQQRDRQRYVFPEEIGRLLLESNVVAVYQASARNGELEASSLALQATGRLLPWIAAVAYCGGPASILFFSRDSRRIAGIRSWLSDWLGIASGRLLPHT